MNCLHKNTVIWEPHMAGARKCNDCGMVYNPNMNPRWFYEMKEISIMLHPETVKQLEDIGEECFTSTRDLIVSAIDKMIFEATVPDVYQGKSEKQVEGSEFFVGLAFAGMASIFMWIGIVAFIRWMGWL